MCTHCEEHSLGQEKEEEGEEIEEDVVFLNGKYFNFAGNECGLRLVGHERS